MRLFRMVLFLYLFLLPDQARAQAQVITTIAGLGAPGFGGDGGPATDAQTSYVMGIATDAAGNLYLADHNNRRVRKIDAAGTITTIAGTGIMGYTGDGGPATMARFGIPKYVAVDTSGNVFVTDQYYSVVRRITPAGIISTYAGTGVAGFSGDGGAATVAQIYSPFGIAADRMGNVYIADQGNNRVRKVDAAGIITTFAGTGVSGIAGNGGPASAAQIGLPKAVCIDRVGNVYIGEQDNNCVRKIDISTGIINTIAGTGVAGYSGDGGPATSALFRFPQAVALDTGDNLFIADYHNHCIRKVNPAGIISTFVGTGVAGFSGDGGPPAMAQLNMPTGVAVNNAGCIYLADHLNQRIRRVAPVNSSPYFTGGALQSVVRCPSDLFALDTMLSVMDTNIGQAISWSVFSPPSHGTASISYSTTSSGGVLIPVGVSYVPVTGYTGPDTFEVRVTDGIASGFTTIAVDVRLNPVAAPITGTDTICVGDTAMLSGPGSGVWSSPHSTVGVGAGTGIITGISTGTATVSYTVTNYCGTVTVTHVVAILPVGACNTGIQDMLSTNSISIIPNPSNGTFTIQLLQSTNHHITITDITGRMLMRFFATGSSQCTLPSACGAGVYFVEVQSSDQRYYEKIVVR